LLGGVKVAFVNTPKQLGSLYLISIKSFCYSAVILAAPDRTGLFQTILADVIGLSPQCGSRKAALTKMTERKYHYPSAQVLAYQQPR
jgi:hypothetical protein